MARYAATCELVSTTTERDSRGVAHEVTVSRKTYCNVMSMSNRAYFSILSTGSRPDALLQVRACDYHDEQDVVFRGDRYSVIRADKTSPDYVRLTLTQKTGDLPNA